MLDLKSVLYTFFVGWRSIISLTKVYFLLQRIKFYLAGQYQRNAMLNFIRIMMVQLLDGALPTIKKVQLTAVKLAWIMLNVPSQMKRNVTFGFIAHLRMVVILQISININIKSAGSNLWVLGYFFVSLALLCSVILSFFLIQSSLIFLFLLIKTQAEKPRLNFKDKYPDSYRNSHPNAPFVVPWVSGVITAWSGWPTLFGWHGMKCELQLNFVVLL